MNIKDIRLKRTLEEVIKSYLVKGILPTSDEVINNVRNHLRGKQINLPFYEFQKESKAFNIDKLNMVKKEVADDVSVASNTILNMYKDIQNMVEKFENEKLKTDYKINTLEAEIKSLLSKIADNGYLESFREDFYDMSNINMSLTDASIDTELNECTLQIMNDSPMDSIKNIDLYSNATLKTSTKDFNESFKKVCTTPGEYSKVLVVSSEQKEIKLESIIDIGYKTYISNIDVGIYLLKQGSLKVYTSIDNSNWEALIDINKKEFDYKLQGIKNIAINKECKYIKLMITKSEADKLNTDGLYEYIYLYDYLKLYQTKYSSNSTIVTKPIKMKEVINELALYVEDEVPAGTNIEYYITCDSTGENPEWRKVSPTNKLGKESNAITFNSKATNRKATFKLDENISQETNKVTENNGIPVYLLGEINNVSLDKYSLNKSSDSWKIEELNINAKTISNATFIENKTNQKYRNVTGSRVLGNINKVVDSYIAPTAIRISSNIKCNSNVSIKKTITCNFPVHVYLNGKLILYKTSNTQRGDVKYDFVKGNNNLTILMNVNPLLYLSSNSSPSTMKPVLELGFDLKDIGIPLGEESSMKEVSEYDLKYNSNLSNIYSLRLNNNATKWQILIREDIYEKYEFNYDYLTSNNKELRLKAVLKNNTNQNQMTPKINAFEIRLLK